MTDPADSFPADTLQTYVRAALDLQGYRFSEERIAEITLQFARIESIARTILSPAAALDAETASGPAPVYRP
jgi:hypothetical protein